MTFAILVKTAVLIAVIMIVVARRRNRKSAVSTEMERIRCSDWQGWIEIANTDYTPLFQGKIVAMDPDGAGALLFGVLVEENAPAALISAIKAGPFTCLTEGRVLVRGLVSHHKKLIMTKMADQDLIERINAAMDQEVKPDTCLVLNSFDIQHMDTEEGMAQFEKIWEASRAKPDAGNSETEEDPLSIQ